VRPSVVLARPDACAHNGPRRENDLAGLYRFKKEISMTRVFSFARYHNSESGRPVSNGDFGFGSLLVECFDRAGYGWIE
jgi:hypothetical protein